MEPLVLPLLLAFIVWLMYQFSKKKSKDHDPTLFPVVIYGAFTNYGNVQMLDNGLRLISKGFAGNTDSFDFTYRSVDHISLQAPHLIVRSPKGKKFKIKFIDYTQAEAVLFRLQSEAERDGNVSNSRTSTTPSDISGSTPNTEVVKSLHEVAASPEAMRLAKLRLSIRKMIGGVVAFVIGIFITNYTYQQAVHQGGGWYVIAWGAILFGPVSFINGLFDWLWNRVPPKPIQGSTDGDNA